MPTDLPYAAEAESSLSREELDVLRTQYYKEIEQGHVTTQSKFNYGAFAVECFAARQRTWSADQGRVGTDQVAQWRDADRGNQAATR